MNITILCTNSDHPIIYDLREWVNKMSSKGHQATLLFDKSELTGGDILFLVSCAQIISSIDRAEYKTTLVLHASDLPKGRGWSPHIWAILNAENEITLSLIEADEPVDSGAIWLQTKILFEGHELLDEINAKLFYAELQLMTEAVETFSEIKPVQQTGDAGEWLRKRTCDDSRVDPEKSIASQFNLFRVVDSGRYPAYFEYKGVKYLLKIEKAKSENEK